jgi:D-alanine-D-alanine ligase
MATKLSALLLVDEETMDAGDSTPQRPAWSQQNLRECDIFEALKLAGCNVRACSFAQLGMNPAAWKRNRTSLIFNMTVHWQGDRRHAARIAALLDMLQIPYTGSGPQAILRASDKYISKHLARMQQVRTPAFCCVNRGENLPLKQIRLPAIVKPRFGGGSEGISERSRVRTPTQLQAQVKRIHRLFCQSAVCETFVEGREVTIGVIGNEHPVALLPRERVFPRSEKGGPAFASYRVKRDHQYCRKWGVRWENAELSHAALQALQSQALTLYKALGLRDYARLDFRLPASGPPVFLEANHNPECGLKSQFFAMFHEVFRLDYASMVMTLAELALRRHGRSRPGLKAFLPVGRSLS